MATAGSDHRLCDRCGAQPARRHSLSVLGPCDLREDHLCPGCQEQADGEAEDATPVLEGSYAHLGPIDFAVLRRSIRRAEAGNAEQESLRVVARELPTIAAAHGQQLPADIRRFVARHAE